MLEFNLQNGLFLSKEIQYVTHIYFVQDRVCYYLLT